MEAIIELSTQITLLTQQQKMRPQSYDQHQRVESQVWSSYRSMEQVHYVGNPYLNTYQ